MVTALEAPAPPVEPSPPRPAPAPPRTLPANPAPSLPPIRNLEARVARLEALVVELVERIVGSTAAEDGAPRRAGRWLRLKLAQRATGYSESGLRKMIRQGRIAFDYEGPHILIDTSTVPRKCRK